MSATQVILSIIQQEIPEHPFVHLLSLREGGIEFVEMHLVEDSPAIGKSIRTLGLPEETAVPLLIRQGKPMVAAFDEPLLPNDRLVAITTPERESALRLACLGQAG